MLALSVWMKENKARKESSLFFFFFFLEKSGESNVVFPFFFRLARLQDRRSKMPRRGRRHPSGRRRNGTSLGEGSRLELRVGEAFDEALKRPLRAAMKTSSPSAASASSLLLASSPSTSTSSAFSSPAAALSASASFGNACISWRRARSWTMVADIPKSVPRRVDASATLRAVPRRRKKEGEETAPTATATPLRPNNNNFFGFLLSPLAAVTTEVRPSVSWDSASGTSASFSGRLGGIGSPRSGSGSGNGNGGAAASGDDGAPAVPSSGSQLTLDAAAAWPGLFAVDKRHARGNINSKRSRQQQQQQQRQRPSTPPPPSPALLLQLFARPPLSSLSVSAAQAYRAPSYGAFVTRGVRARLEPPCRRVSLSFSPSSSPPGGKARGSGSGGGMKTLLEAWATARPVVVADSSSPSPSSGPYLAPRALTAELSTDLGTTTQLSLTAEVGSPQALAAFFGNGNNNSNSNAKKSPDDDGSGEKRKRKRITSAIKVTAFTLANHRGGGGGGTRSGAWKRGQSRNAMDASLRPASAYEGSFFAPSSSSSLTSSSPRPPLLPFHQLSPKLRSLPSWLSSLPLPDGARVEGGLSLEAPRWLASAMRPPSFFGKKAEATAATAAAAAPTTATAKETPPPPPRPFPPPPRLSLRSALCTGGGARGNLRSRSWRAEARLSGIVLGSEREAARCARSPPPASLPRPLDLALRVGPGSARAAVGRGGGGQRRIELFAEASGNGKIGSGSGSGICSGGVSRSGSGVVCATTAAAAAAAAAASSTPPQPPAARAGSGGLLGSLASLSLASAVAAAASSSFSSSSSKYGDSLRVGVAWGSGCGGGGGGGGGGSGGGSGGTGGGGFSAASPPWQSGPGGDSLVGPSDAEADAGAVGGRPSGCVCAVRERRGRVSVRAWAFLPF